MDCPYYHGNIDGHDAESRLIRQNAVDGNFLIRDSGSTKGVYIMCLLFEKKLYQYRILRDKNRTFYIESVKNQAVRQTNSLNELVELYLSKGPSNGLKTALFKGVRKDGAESDSESEDDQTYVDIKYVFSTVDKDTPDSIVSGVVPPPTRALGALPSRAKSTHIYAEPADLVQQPTGTESENSVRNFYKEQFNRTDQSKVSSEFAKKVQAYVDHSLVSDVMDMSKEESKLSFNHLPLLKDLIHSETTVIQSQLGELLCKLDYLRNVLAKPGSDPLQQSTTHIESESSFNTLVGHLSKAKQELCTLELEAVHSYNEMTGYANVDPLAIKHVKPAQPDIPTAQFVVRSAGKAILGSAVSLTLKVDIQKGLLYIVKESASQTLDQTNTFCADKILQVIKSTQNCRLLEVLIEGRRKETFSFDDIRQREHFCQLIQQMKKVHSRERIVDSLSLFCGTWNMGNELPPQLGGLQPWIKSHGVGKTRVSSLANEPHDLYAIGTQEAKVSERDWVNKLKRLLHNQFGIDFHLVDVCTLWQIRLVVFIRPEHKNRISTVRQAVVRTGIANALGNKGAATISLNFDGTSLCFLCCHLAANRERLARRNQNSRDIMKNLASSLGTKGYSDFDITNQFNHVFCLGDLNYRVDGDIKDVLPLAENEQFSEMLKLDQLLDTINTKKAFYGFDEEMITFPPTYRYHKQANNSYNWKKVKSSGVKINAPSWCDRVIWKSLPSCPITNTSYGLVQDVTTSDHKPVFASFSIQILPMNIHRSVGSIVTPIEIKITKVSCRLLIQQEGDKQTDYSISVMGSCLEAPSESQPATAVPLSEDRVGIEWDGTMSLKPTFSDASHLQTQHVLMAVKSFTEGTVIGDTVISLMHVFQSSDECNFQCDLVSLGGKTGFIRGTMKAILKDSAAPLAHANAAAPKRSSGNIIVNDIYASPLCDLSWDDDVEDTSHLEPPLLPTPQPDSIPRIRDRAMSFVSRNHHSPPTRSLPLAPNDYDLPPNEPQANKKKTKADNYYNIEIEEYYNIGKLKPPSIKGRPHQQSPASVTEEEEYSCYEEAEDAKCPSPYLAAARPKVPARAVDSSNALAQHISSSQGTNAVTSWLMSISMPQYVNLFKRNNWTTMDQVSRLTNEQLADTGIKRVHIFQIAEAIRNL